MTGSRPQADPAFTDGELRLALYYQGLRDKIAALNIAVVGFSFPVYDKLSALKTEFFSFLIVLGALSFAAAIRSGIAYNVHYRNYERYMAEALKVPVDVSLIFQESRAIYAREKRNFSFVTLGVAFIPSHIFWALSIGLICPVVAFFVYWPW